MEITEIDRVRDALKTYPKGITIAELAKQLGMNRISASKYLNMLLASGQAEMRVFGPSKVFYPCLRIPLSAILNFSTSHLLVMDDNLTIIDANDPLLGFFGLEKEDLVGQRIDYSPIAGFFDSTLVQQLKGALESHGSNLEIRITLQGKESVLKIKCIPTVFENGDRGVSLIADDVTEITRYRQHLEELVNERAEELQKTNDDLKKEINRHKKSRIDLENSEKKYRELVENANSIILKTDMDGTIAFFNEFAQHFFGYTESEVLGKSLYDTIIPATDASGNNLRKIREEMRLDPDKYGNYEGENLKKDGESVWISWTNKFIRDIKGEVTGILSIGNDITQRKRAEDALEESEERFRYAMEASSDGLWDWDLTTDRGYFSPAYYRMLGYEPDALPATGQAWAALIHPDDRKRTLSINQDCIENRCQNFEVDYRLKAKDGSWKWILARGKAVSRDAGGRALRMIGTHVNITERKLAENLIRTNQILLTEAMELAHLANWEYDYQTGMFTFDDRFYALYGTTAGLEGGYQMPGDVYLRELIPPEDRHLVSEEMERCRNISDPHYVSQLEHRIIRRDGGIRYVVVRSGRTMDKDGHVTRIHGVSQDVTEQKVAAERLKFQNALLATIHETTIAGILAVDETGKVLFYNRRFVEMWGISAEDIGKNDDAVLLASVQEKILGYQQFLEKVQDIYNHRLEVIRDEIQLKDGRSFDRYSAAMSGPEGNYYGRVWYFEDITEKKTAEEKLQRTKQKLSAIVDFLPDATFVIDTSGTVVAWNRAMEDLTGRKAGDIVGIGNFEHCVVLHGKRAPMLIDFAVHPDQEIPEKYHFNNHEKNKLVAWTYSTHLRSDGIYLWGFAVPLYDSNGTIIGAIEAIRDVTGVKMPHENNPEK